MNKISKERLRKEELAIANAIKQGERAESSVREHINVIRKERLYRAAGYRSFRDYVEGRVGELANEVNTTKAYLKECALFAEMEEKLPEIEITGGKVKAGGQRSMRELQRIKDSKGFPDFGRMKKILLQADQERKSRIADDGKPGIMFRDIVRRIVREQLDGAPTIPEMFEKELKRTSRFLSDIKRIDFSAENPRMGNNVVKRYRNKLGELQDFLGRIWV